MTIGILLGKITFRLLIVDGKSSDEPVISKVTVVGFPPMLLSVDTVKERACYSILLLLAI
jgi:hypothetical protein